MKSVVAIPMNHTKTYNQQTDIEIVYIEIVYLKVMAN